MLKVTADLLFWRLGPRRMPVAKLGHLTPAGFRVAVTESAFNPPKPTAV